MPPQPRRGRRAGDSSSREDILKAARHLFGIHGYPGTTIRMVAADAGVDPRLVTHYFGSKGDLFVAAVELPYDPSHEFALAAAGERSDLGRRVADFVVRMLETPEGQQTMSGLIRAATSEDRAAEMVRDLLVDRVMMPVATILAADHAELRSAMVGSQMGGFVLARYILRLQPLVDADHDSLVAMLAPVLQHYLTAPLDLPTGPRDWPTAGHDVSPPRPHARSARRSATPPGG